MGHPFEQKEGSFAWRPAMQSVLSPTFVFALRLALFCCENHLNDTVIVRRSETVALGLHELGTSILGLLPCRIQPDHLSPDSGRAHVQIASSGDRAKLVRHRVGPFWKGLRHP